MKDLAVISDLHGHSWRDHSRILSNGRNSRLQHAVQALGRVRRYCREHGIKLVLFPGDLVHQRHTTEVLTITALYGAVREFKEDDITVVMIPGNHDQSSLDGSVHIQRLFADVAIVVTKPSTIKLGELAIHCVPYMEDWKAFREALKSDRPRWAKRYLLMAHGGIQGAVTGPVEYKPAEEIKVDHVPGYYDFAFFGHYHKRQRLRSRLWYVGSPMQHTRGEAQDLGKGFLVYNLERKRIVNVPLGFPEFVSTTEDEVLNRPGDYRGNFVDVTVDKYEKRVIEILEANGAASIHADPIERVIEESRRLEVSERDDLSTTIDAYVKKYAPKGLNKDELKRLALRFLRLGEL